MSPWNPGRATVEALLANGDLERVPVNLDGAQGLVARARRHLFSAESLAETDVELAYDALHAANRKALTAVLLAQGLRPTRQGGHISVYEAVRAQLDPPLGAVLVPYERIRRARNVGDYVDDLPATADDVHADLPECQAIVEVAAKVIGQMPMF
ncbi:MAG: HEPN domain-containing protein [Micrococcales bacterium]|nr:HEPN domain-containing protein [Micrococcales bacterium]MCL2849632.1 HEPN domain-containing protein [Micrococcales bacterium]